MKRENVEEVKKLIAELKKSRSPITKVKAARLEELLEPVTEKKEEPSSKWSWDGKDPFQLARQAIRILYKAPYQLNEAKNELHKKEEETQDILHALEFLDLTKEKEDELTDRLKEIRRARRVIKNFVDLMEPFGEFTYEHKDFVKDLKEIVKKMSKTAEHFEKRCYTPRYAKDLEKAFKEIAPTKEEK